MAVYITLTVLVVGLGLIVKNQDYVKLNMDVSLREHGLSKRKDRQQCHILRLQIQEDNQRRLITIA